MQGEAVGKRAIRGTAWIGASRFGAHALSTLRLLLLAWLLGDRGPEYLGVFGVALLALATVEALSQTGISQAIIQRKGDVDPYLQTAWTTQVFRGLSLAALLYLAAPWVADFFDKPEVAQPLRVLALAPLLTGAQSIAVLFFSKDLEFHKTFILQTGTAFVELVVCSVMAWQDPSVWALVGGKLAGLTYSLVVSYAIGTRRAGLGWSWPRMRELSGFGFWIFVTSLVAFTLVQGGDAVIGKLLPAASLGLYQMAARLSMLPALELARVISVVTFPAYSLLQDKPERLQQAFLKTFFVVGVIGLAATGAVIALSVDFVDIFLSERWADVAPLMTPLAIWGVSRGLGASQGALFQASGRPALAALFPGLMLIVFAATVLPVTRNHGALGVAWLLAGIGIASQLLRYPLAAWVLDLPAKAIYMRTVVPLSALGVALLGCHLVSDALSGAPPTVRFGTLLACYLVLYGACLLLWDRFSQYRLLTLVREILRARRGRK